MTLPSASTEVVPSGANLVPSPPDKVAVFVGCSSKGPLLVPRSLSSHKAIGAMYGCGGAARCAAYSAAKTGANVLFLRLPPTAVAATKSAVVKTGAGTFVATITGTPNDAYEIVLIFTVGGTIGTGPISYKWSKDGGENFTTPAALGAGTSIALTGTGLTVSLVATQTTATNDQIEFHTTAASQTILPVTITRADASTSAITATGTPEDAYEALLEVLTGGTIGTAGIVVRYSLDGGRTWSKKTALGVAVSLALLDGTEASGVTVNFAAGTLDAADAVTFGTTGPAWQVSDAQTAFDALMASIHKAGWSFAHFVGEVDPTKVAGIAALMDTLKTTKVRPSWAAMSARDWGTNEDKATWTARVAAAFGETASDRVAVGAGMARITCPLTGRRNRRPAMWSVVPRLLKRPIEEDPGRKLTGALSDDVSIHDDDGALVEYDANDDVTLHDARFVTLRTWTGETGVYVTRGNMLSAEDSDIQRIAYRRVLDLADDIYRQVMQRQIENKFRRWSATAQAPFVAGDIYEPDAIKIEREIRHALQTKIVDLGMASAVSVKLTRTPVSLGSGKFRLLCEVKVTGLGYIDEFQGTIGFTDPALDALLGG